MRLWEQGQGGPAYRRLRDLESAIRDQKELFQKPDLELVYRQKIQALSPLLYCKQIQLRCTEFDVKDDELLVVKLQAYKRGFRSLVKSPKIEFPIIGLLTSPKIEIPYYRLVNFTKDRNSPL